MKKIFFIRTIIILPGLAITILFSSCAALLLPRNQKVTFTSTDPQASVFMDQREIGKGNLFEEKIPRGHPRQLIVKTPGYKDTYQVLVQSRYSPAYFGYLVLDLGLTLGLGIALDVMLPQNVSFPRSFVLRPKDKLVVRAPSDKFIDISNMRLDISKRSRDISFFHLPYKTSLEQDMLAAEKKKELSDLNQEMLIKRGKYSSVSKFYSGGEIKYDDTKFSSTVYATLKKTGFVDTVNRIFSDNNNTLVLEGSIRKVNLYYITGKRLAAGYYKSKISIRWYIKNTYNEILDSADTKEISGDFVDIGGDFMDRMFGDAVDISYLKLHSEGFLKPYLDLETEFKNPAVPLYISDVTSVVSDKSDAVIASVIVKNTEGHGSGFAVSEDGYILTNYHVIAGKYNNKPASIKVLTSAGEELEGQVIRYNKFRDLALLKVNKKFDKAFRFSNVKSFENLQDVYTIGAPKSIELGQSFAMGVISNERKVNNNNLLQLGMSVNGGNSGGPVFDAKGHLHGVIVSKLAGQNTEGVSFAIPGYLIEEYLNIHYK